MFIFLKYINEVHRIARGGGARYEPSWIVVLINIEIALDFVLAHNLLPWAFITLSNTR